MVGESLLPELDRTLAGLLPWQITYSSHSCR